jgi:hypothetical protein
MSRKYRYRPLPYDDGRYQPDNGEAFTQWWYFDAEFKSGHRFMIIMQPRMLGNLNDDEAGAVPGISMVVMDPEHHNYHTHEYYPGRFEGDLEHMRGRFGDNLVECEEGRYRLRIHQGGVGAELEYKPLLPPWPPFVGPRGYLAKPLLWPMAPGKFFHYVSFIPRGQVKGRLFLPDGEADVEGVGYHEQGRINTPLAHIFNHWYWIRIFLDDWTFIFPIGSAPGHLHDFGVVALLVYHKDECVTDVFDPTGLFVNHKVLEYQSYEPAGRDDVPRRCLLTARTLGLRLRIEMDLQHVLESFCWQSLVGKTTLQPAWMQHEMDVKVDLRWKGQPIHLEGQGIFESMLIHKGRAGQ